MNATRSVKAHSSRYGKRGSKLLRRFSHGLGDVILLAQLLGACANFIWHYEISTTDLVGFIYVGGDFAGLLAYFTFILFGLLFFAIQPRRFWYSLHPLNLGIALILLSSHRLWSANGLLLTLAVLTGALISRLIFYRVILYPRASLALLLLITPIARYAMPRELAPYAFILFGTVLAMQICTPPLLKWMRRR
ncbi:MAG: hypothetical protein K0U15_00465 [Proteobacteria bacterium]|nr:hypothetical protein [Pseudomonadota bacterium]